MAFATAGYGAGWMLIRVGWPAPERRRLYWYRDGLAQIIPGERAPRVISWNEIESVTMTPGTAPGRALTGLKLRGVSGTGITVTTGGRYRWPKVSELADAARGAIAPDLIRATAAGD